jgi:Tfp pilus assembly protein PilO
MNLDGLISRFRFDLRAAMRPALIAGCAILAVNAAIYMLLVRPRIRSYEDLSGAQDTYTRELSTAERTQKTLSDFYDKLMSTEQNTSTFYEKILGTKQDNMIHIQQEIIDIGTEYRISPESVSYTNKDKDEDGLEEFSIQVPVEGDYGDLRSFLAKLENSKSFLIVDSITLQGTKEGGLQLQLNINITTFFNAPWLKQLKGTPGRSRRS